LQAYPATVTRTQTDTATPVTPAFLASFDVIILDKLQRTYSSEEASAMEAWVRAGGGVLSMTGFANSVDPDITAPNSLLAPFGGQYIPPLLESSSLVTITDFSPSPVTTTVFALPFAGGYAVQPQPGWTVTAYDTGTPIAMIGEHGGGRIYMWGDEWVEYSMEWGNNVQAFWQNGIDWLTHRK
jgi:hypothetical protein